jgi:hypothetical protein
MKKNITYHVNSKKNISSKDVFNWNFIQREKKQTGAIVVTKELAGKIRSGGISSPFAGFDLLKNDLVGSCVLIDYNYILMCMHTFTSFSSTEMAQNQVYVVFNNEYTQSTVDTSNPKAETNRPFAYLRGDLDWWGPTNTDQCNEDFALVPIKWNNRAGVDDFHLLNHMAALPDPRSGNAIITVGQSVCCLESYSSKQQVEDSLKEPFANYASYSEVSTLNQGPMVEACTLGKQKIYALAGFYSCFGSSGSPVYNTSGVLVGIIGGKVRTESFFLPLDKIYNCQSIGHQEKISTADKIRNIYDYQHGVKKP